MDFHDHLAIKVTGSNDAVIVKIADENGMVYGEGTAKRHPKDPFKPELGVNLATARALEHAASMVRGSLPKYLRTVR